MKRRPRRHHVGRSMWRKTADLKLSCKAFLLLRTVVKFPPQTLMPANHGVASARLRVFHWVCRRSFLKMGSGWRTTGESLEGGSAGVQWARCISAARRRPRWRRDYRHTHLGPGPPFKAAAVTICNAKVTLSRAAGFQLP